MAQVADPISAASSRLGPANFGCYNAGTKPVRSALSSTPPKSRAGSGGADMGCGWNAPGSPAGSETLPRSPHAQPTTPDRTALGAQSVRKSSAVKTAKKLAGRVAKANKVSEAADALAHAAEQAKLQAQAEAEAEAAQKTEQKTRLAAEAAERAEQEEEARIALAAAVARAEAEARLLAEAEEAARAEEQARLAAEAEAAAVRAEEEARLVAAAKARKKEEAAARAAEENRQVIASTVAGRIAAQAAARAEEKARKAAEAAARAQEKKRLLAEAEAGETARQEEAARLAAEEMAQYQATVAAEAEAAAAEAAKLAALAAAASNIKKQGKKATKPASPARTSTSSTGRAAPRSPAVPAHTTLPLSSTKVGGRSPALKVDARPAPPAKAKTTVAAAKSPVQKVKAGTTAPVKSPAQTAMTSTTAATKSPASAAPAKSSASSVKKSATVIKSPATNVKAGPAGHGKPADQNVGRGSLCNPTSSGRRSPSLGNIVASILQEPAASPFAFAERGEYESAATTAAPKEPAIMPQGSTVVPEVSVTTVAEPDPIPAPTAAPSVQVDKSNPYFMALFPDFSAEATLPQTLPSKTEGTIHIVGLVHLIHGVSCLPCCCSDCDGAAHCVSEARSLCCFLSRRERALVFSWWPGIYRRAYADQRGNEESSEVNKIAAVVRKRSVVLIRCYVEERYLSQALAPVCEAYGAWKSSW
jgi:hypothetical protein